MVYGRDALESPDALFQSMREHKAHGVRVINGYFLGLFETVICGDLADAMASRRISAVMHGRRTSTISVC